MKILTQLVASGVAALGLVSSAFAAVTDYPTRAIELVVPYTAGGGTDVLARAFAEAARKHLPQTMIVVNKPGASGIVGWTDVINSKPDGYKIAVLSGELTTMTHLGLTKITYEDLVPIAQLNYDPAAITVRADAPWKTIEEFLADAKKRNGDMQVGNGGNGGIWHLAAAALEDKTGVKFNHVPFAGAAPSITSLLGGHIDATAASAAEVYPYVAAGKLKTLAVMSDKRIKGFENVPTLKERNIDVLVGNWRGLAVAKSTPPEIVSLLREATSRIAKEQVLLDAMDRQKMGYLYADGDTFRTVMARDHAYYKELIARLNIKN
jgi:tripartite-type tricarboxylate transporter receptor subunit TctC